MIDFANRPYGGESDLEALITLVKQRPIERLTEFPSIIDLSQMLRRTEEQQNTQLWEDESGYVVGYVMLHDWGGFQFEVRETLTGDALCRQLITWAIETARRQGWQSISTGLTEADFNRRRRAILEARGFSRRDGHTLYFERSLNEPIPPVVLPAGFSIRHVTGEHEVEALVELHRAAFGTRNMDVEGRLSWMQTAEYEPELDLVVVSPEGRLVSTVFCSISYEENGLTGRLVGSTDPVATHPNYQRLGLARALLLTGLTLLKKRGIAFAQLGTGSWNPAMQRTAKSVGYRVVGKKYFYEKLL